MTVLTYELRGGGTPYGITTAQEVAYGCKRRAWLKSQESGDIAGKAALTGTFVHALLEIYYSKRATKTKVQDVVFKLCTDELIQHWQKDHLDQYLEAQTTAKRVVAAYLEEPFSRWPGVQAVEEYIEISEQPAPLLPHPYSAKLDLVVKLTKVGCKKMKAWYFLDCQPGYYIVDHKTIGAMREDTIERYSSSVQGPAYAAAWNVGKPRSKWIQGIFYNFLITTAQPKFLVTLQYCDRYTDRLLNNLVTETKDYWPLDKVEIPPPCNPGRCYDWGRKCYFLAAGLCNRI